MNKKGKLYFLFNNFQVCRKTERAWSPLQRQIRREQRSPVEHPGEIQRPFQPAAIR